MDRPVGSFFPHGALIIEVVYDEFNDCNRCIYDPITCDEIADLRGTCCNRMRPVIFQEAKEIPKKKK